MDFTNLTDLIATLTEIRETYGDEIPLHVASQPGYPIRHDIVNVRVITDDEDTDCAEDTHSHCETHDSQWTPGFNSCDAVQGSPVLWIAIDQQTPYNESPYAPSAAFEEE